MTTRLFLAGLLASYSLCAADIASPQVIAPDAKTGIARAVVIDGQNLAHTTQILPLNPKGEIIGKGNAAHQLEVVLGVLGTALQAGGSDLHQVVKINVYAADDATVAATKTFFASFFRGLVKPAVTFVVGKLSHPDALVAMDAVAVSVHLPSQADVRRVHAKKLSGDEAFAEVAVLPPGGVIYISGQAIKGAIPEATAKTLEQLEATLKFLKLEKKDVVSAKAFLQSVTEAASARKEFATFFQGELVPPLSFVDWTSGKDLPIEIEMVVAAKGTGADVKEPVSYMCPPFMTGSPVYSKVTRVNHGKLIYVSGVYGTSTNNAEAEVNESFAALKDVLQKADSDLNHLVKATYYVSNPQAATKLNDLRPKYYDPKTPPAASKAPVKSVGVPGKWITFDMIAVPAK
ncbi:MAG: Endoribonuclease [Verrucomicrobiales bacterium]|nr:Endoribonuclease [Verrucomicrobiales bacterium]